MQRYKSLFRESNIVDISNLIWNNKEIFQSWDEAEDSIPDGWRLPTIQELRTAYIKNVPGFKKDFYWSSNEYSSKTNLAWCLNFENQKEDSKNKSVHDAYVRYVKEK